MKLTKPSETSAIMRRFGFRTIRDLGQNFLVDDNVLRKIIKAGAPGPGDVVLEIGTGIGTLTVALAAAGAEVLTVEIDRRLEPIIAETLAGLDNVKVVQADAMELPPETAGPGGRPLNKLIANLPYGVAAPVILRSFGLFEEIETMVVMVQKEIADRIMAEPGSKNYSGFTVKLGYFCSAERVLRVSRNVFIPRPNVDSALIKLVRRDPGVELGRSALFALITAGFSQRRKSLANALASGIARVEKGDVEQALESIGLDRAVRAERLTLTQFDRLGTLLPL